MLSRCKRLDSNEDQALDKDKDIRNEQCLERGLLWAFKITNRSKFNNNHLKFNINFKSHTTLGRIHPRYSPTVYLGTCEYKYV
jgi:hypothetical protein